MKTRVKGVKLTALDEIFTDDDREKVIEPDVSTLTSFKNHPFKVEDNGDMELLAESVKQYGVLVPVVVCEIDGSYELVSGHRRKRAAEIAGIATIPAIVRELDDDEAVIIMADSNLQRERILPSEKAWAYKMKLEAIKRCADRPLKNSRQVGENFETKFSVDIISENSDDSSRQIQRYILLTELLPEFLNMADEKKLSFVPAVELSYLRTDEQTALLKFISETEISPSLSQSQRLKKFSQEGKLTVDMIEAVMSEEKAEPFRFALNKTTLSQYFPKEYTARQIESTILELLENRQKSQINEVTA